MNRHIGIVLKRCNSLYKIALFDNKQGRIDTICRNNASVSPGMLLMYTVSVHRHIITIDSIEIISLPFTLIQSDILFLHYVLEIVYTIIPIGAVEKNLMSLLLVLYTKTITTRGQKKIFLFKLFTILGINPSYEYVQYTQIDFLYDIPVDRIDVSSLDLKCEQDLDEWLRLCVQENQMLGQLKTAKFLTISKVHE